MLIRIPTNLLRTFSANTLKKIENLDFCFLKTPIKFLLYYYPHSPSNSTPPLPPPKSSNLYPTRPPFAHLTTPRTPTITRFPSLNTSLPTPPLFLPLLLGPRYLQQSTFHLPRFCLSFKLDVERRRQICP